MRITKIINNTATEIQQENVVRIIDSCQMIDVPANETRFITFSGSRNVSINVNCADSDTYEVELLNSCLLDNIGYNYYGMVLTNPETGSNSYKGSNKLFLPFDAKIVGFEIKNNSSNALKVNVDFRSL